MTQSFVGHILDIHPINIEGTHPFVTLCPGIKTFIIINFTLHLGHTTETHGTIDTEE